MNIDPKFLQYLPFVVGGGVTVLVLLILWISNLRRRARGGNLPLPSTRSSEWSLPEQSFADRRTTVRREGPPVKILISSPAFKSGVDRGYVLDRSTGGLRVAMGVAMVPGSTMQVRAQNAPDTTPWVTVVIRSCRNTGKHYEIGCEFDKTPPWNVLLLFG